MVQIAVCFRAHRQSAQLLVPAVQLSVRPRALGHTAIRRVSGRAAQLRAAPCSAIDSVVSGELQPRVFPDVEELKDKVEQVTGRSAEESLRSDLVIVSNQALLTQSDVGPNMFELEDGSVATVPTVPPPLGQRALSSAYVPLVVPRMPRFEDIAPALTNLKEK